MQQFGGPIHGAAEGRGDRLVPEAYAEDRHRRGSAFVRRGLRGEPHDVDADTGLLRRTRPGGQQDPVVFEGLGGRHLVVAAYVDVGPELAKVLNEVEDEGVVVIDDEDACHWASPGAEVRGQRQRVDTMNPPVMKANPMTTLMSGLRSFMTGMLGPAM